jgi:inner membrane transporter RhtA
MSGSGVLAAISPSRLDRVPPEALIIAGTFSVQVGGGVASSLVREFGPLPVVAMRVAFGAAMLLAFRWARVGRASRSALASCLALGLILAVMNSLFYVSISRIPLGVAVTIEFLGPLSVAVLGSRRWLDLVWVALAATGIYVLAGGRLEGGDELGVAAAVGAGVCWGLYIPTGRWVAREWPDGRGLTLAMVVAAAIVVPVAVVASDPRPLLVAPVALAGGVLIALFSSTIPYTVELVALRRMRAATFGVLMSLEPGVAAAVGFLMLGQTLDTTDVAAIAAVAVASAGASLSARRFAATPGELEGA